MGYLFFLLRFLRSHWDEVSVVLLLLGLGISVFALTQHVSGLKQDAARAKEEAVAAQVREMQARANLDALQAAFARARAAEEHARKMLLQRRENDAHVKTTIAHDPKRGNCWDELLPAAVWMRLDGTKSP